MNIHQIIISDTANGVGQRVSIFVSGCTKHCPGCHNKPGWNFDFGKPFDEARQQYILNQFRTVPVYDGITLLGGDPDEPENQSAVLAFIKRFRSEFPDKTVWLYTGDLFEDICPGGRLNTPDLTQILIFTDVLVDGAFVEEEKDVRLNFRGSRNQRIIDVKSSLSAGQAIELTQYYNTPADRKSITERENEKS